MADSWHHFRGASNDNYLRDVGKDLIVAVQIDDARAEIRGTLLEDTCNDRLLPGEGATSISSTSSVCSITWECTFPSPSRSSRARNGLGPWRRRAPSSTLDEGGAGGCARGLWQLIGVIPHCEYRPDGRDGRERLIQERRMPGVGEFDHRRGGTQALDHRLGHLP
jgi:hypothetical protein